MTEQRRVQRVQPDFDDVQVHGIREADAQAAEGDDTEGHKYRWNADAEAAEDDDVEGHMPLSQADADRGTRGL
jgi:hypothetical protein